MIQRRAACFVLNNYSRFASVTRMLDTLKWPTLETDGTLQKSSCFTKYYMVMYVLNFITTYILTDPVHVDTI